MNLAWDNSADPVAGYRVYYGKSSRNYINSFNLGNSASCRIAVQGSGAYYFAVKAYDSSGNESGFSNEVGISFVGAPNLIAASKLNGDGKADIVGLTATGAIYYSTNLGSWYTVPGTLGNDWVVNN